ncbi:hypothetical protein QQP08_002086 [Theobroma cacao]|nr:hypothetical protein QQP08_002086 [Theobroma cacao]
MVSTTFYKAKLSHSETVKLPKVVRYVTEKNLGNIEIKDADYLEGSLIHRLVTGKKVRDCCRRLLGRQELESLWNVKAS